MKMRPKETETPEMLLARFDKRIQQLTARQDEIKSWYDMEEAISKC